MTPDTLETCEKCDGQGWKATKPVRGGVWATEPCPSCLGVGRVLTETVIDKVEEE